MSIARQCQFEGCEIVLKKYSKSEYYLCKKHRTVYLKHGRLSYVREMHPYDIYTSEYRAWVNMKQRCDNTKHPQYKDYGGRGIIVSDELYSYKRFIEHIGLKKDPSLTLERIDNERGYEVGNIKWATRTEQIHNRRKSRWEKRKVLLKKRYLLNKSGLYYSKYSNCWIVKVSTENGQKTLYSGKDSAKALNILSDYANSL